MKPVDLNVNHIADVKIRDFADFSNPEGEQTAIVKVNRNTFKVTVSAKGDVDVAFKSFGFLNVFKSRTKARLAQQIQSQIEDWKKQIAAHDPDAIKATIAENTSEGLMNIFGVDPDTGYADARGTEVAVYGFSTIRAQNAKGLEDDHKVTYAMIDHYNRGIGVDPSALGVIKIGERLENIKNGTCKINPPEDGYSIERITQWMHFLQRPENFRKIDILGRLREYVGIAAHPTRDDKQATGWRGEFARNGLKKAMEAFVRKKLPGDGLKIDMDPYGHNVLEIDDDLVPLMAKALCLIVTKGNGKITADQIKTFIREAAVACGIELQDPHVYALQEALDLIVSCAFFRQTSKLGLEFFKETSTPVLFYWTNYKGQAIPENNRALTNKWWKNPAESIKKHYGASITFSEMRHVQKMLKVKPKAQDIFNEEMHPFNLIKVEGQLI